MARKKGKGITKTDHVWKFFGDGIWEIALGMAVIWGGVLIRLQWSILWMLPALILVLLIYWLKKKFAFPYAKEIHLPRVKKRVTTELVILTVVIFFVLLTILKDEPGLAGYWKYIQENSLTLIGITSSIISLFIVFITKFSQFALHAFMLFLTFLMEEAYFKEAPIGLAIGAGIVMFISGVFTLRQFIKAHPVKS
jgi:hypothetical protein